MFCCQCNVSVEEETFSCDFCKSVYCLECSEICSSEVRVLQLKKNRTLCFLCKSCKASSANELLNAKLKSLETILLLEIQKLRKDIQQQDGKLMDQSNLISKLLKEISVMKTLSGCETYANVTKNKNNDVIVVKPKEKQESSTTRNDLKGKINPRSMAIAVENMKPGKEGSVIINCGDVNSKQKIRQTVERELGNKYSVIEGKQRDPKIIIRGVEEDFIDGDDETIINALREQNVLPDTAIMKVLTKFKRKGGVNKGNIILIVDVDTKELLCKMEKLNIGWRRCVVHEYFHVIRCFKCCRYGHISSKCENHITCLKCAGSHTSSGCTSGNHQCINCIETNNKFKKNLNVNHMVTDSSCPCYKRIIDIEDRKNKHCNG